MAIIMPFPEQSTSNFHDAMSMKSIWVIQVENVQSPVWQIIIAVEACVVIRKDVIRDGTKREMYDCITML